MMSSANSSPSVRILGATGPDEPLAEITLATRFGETLPLRQLLQRWQFDEQVHALLSRAGLHRALASSVPPQAVATSGAYQALAGSPVGFLVQFAALCAWRDRWGRQALLQYPEGAHGLWRALVWAGTGRRPGGPQVLPGIAPAARAGMAKSAA